MYEPGPYDKEAAEKFAKTLEKLLPLLDEIRKTIQVMKTMGEELDAVHQQMKARLKS